MTTVSLISILILETLKMSMVSLIEPRRDHQLKSQFVKKSNEYESEPFSGVTVKDTLVILKF